MKNISPEELYAALNAGKKISFLDVREPEELQYGVFEGATCIPMGEVPQRVEEAKAALIAGDMAVVYCRVGGRSERVARFLESQGLSDLFNLAGGTLACVPFDSRFQKY